MALTVMIFLSPEKTNAAKASFKKCLTCHQNLQKEIKSSGAHAPFKNFQCGDCHNAHASNHEFLIKRKIGDLCISCHKTKTEQHKYLHVPVQEGNCIKCHKPHVSKHQNLLNKSKKELCFSCHKYESIFPAGKKHQPAKQGQCLKCHNPHGSNDFPLLNQDNKKLCVSCHSASQKAHQGYSVAKTNCASCHNAHSSANNNLIKKNKHKPFDKNNCSACHVKTNGKAKLSNKYGEGAQACLRCHKNISKDFDKINNHMQKGLFCINCHNPHASDQSGLKKGALTRICFDCHQDTKWRMGDKKVKRTHPEVEKGNCNACHNAHGSDFRLFFLSDEIGTCTKCHKRHAKFSHPVGTNIIDPRSKRDIACITCHNLMGSQHEFVLRSDRKRELCIQCHASY